ncbi:UNVERIFIED_CONTAM: hypothetical protein Q9R58_17675 [Methylobacteriaceae bacterium AG10]|nr:hypothetical protein [Methylobacteriaceae bacterium AG10]
MTFTFAPADTFTERAGLFVSLTGGTNSGKTFSALRLARGIAGPDGKVAVLDTEGGRTLHLKEAFAFDANVMDPPFRPERFAQAALAAEQAGYDALVIDSFSMEWVGLGGVLDWQGQELQRMAGDDFRKQERMKMASWIKPKTAHKAMVYSLLQRRIPIIFSIRGEESVKPGEAGEKPTKVFKSVCNSQFPYEVTVSFRLETERKGYVDLSDPRSYKMEGAHEGIFRNGDRISEEHGAALAAWARGEQPARPAPQGEKPRRGKDALFTDARAKAEEGSFAYHAWRADLPDRARTALDEIGDELAAIADAADRRDAGDYGLDDERAARGEAA